MVMRSVYVVESFVASEHFQLDDEVEFRKIDDDDIDRFGREPWSRRLPVQAPWLDTRQWICDIRHSGAKSFDTINWHNEGVQEIVTALALTKSGSANFKQLGSYLESPFLHSGTGSGGRPISSGGIAGPVDLSAKDIEEFKSNYGRVQRIQNNSKSLLQLPLRRMRAASERTASEDKLVDYVIGLERLLARDTPALESTWRFRLRGAALLPESFGDAKQRMKLLGDLYGARSGIVHGNVSDDKVIELLPKAEAALRSIILWYIRRTEAGANADQIGSELDEALVGGGSTYAKDFA